MSTSNENTATIPAFSAGLEGIYACYTNLSEVMGSEGKLIFNGFNAVELAETKTFEEVWFVLRKGRLPSCCELSDFRFKVEELGHLTNDEVKLVLKLRGGEPMSAFRSSLSAIANGRNFKSWLKRDQ